MKIISRKDAKSKGLKKYFTGKACVHGHICDRYISTYQCVECSKKYKRKHSDKIKSTKIDNSDNWLDVRYKVALTNNYRFYEGTSCLGCGNTKRYTNNSECVCCSAIRMSDNKRKAYIKEYRTRPESILKNKATFIKYLANHSKDEIAKNKKNYSNSYTNYTSYFDKLTVEEFPRDNGGILEVKCANCRQYFKPKQMHVNKRVQCLKGNYKGESRLYCSEKCKQDCSIYNKQSTLNGTNSKNTRPLQGQWAKLVKERDNFICKNCGKQEKIMFAHHKIPVSVCDMLSTDVDNGITLCKKCHIKVHKKGGCTYRELHVSS